MCVYINMLPLILKEYSELRIISFSCHSFVSLFQFSIFHTSFIYLKLRNDDKEITPRDAIASKYLCAQFPMYLKKKTF